MNFDQIYKMIIEADDIRTLIGKREAKNQRYASRRDQGGYDDMITPFTDKEDAGGFSYSQPIKEVQFYFDGKMISRYGHPHIYKYQQAKGADLEKYNVEDVMIGPDDEAGVEAGFMKAYRVREGMPEFSIIVDENVVKIVFPSDSGIDKEDIPEEFNYGSIRFTRAKTRREDLGTIVFYVPARAAENVQRKSYLDLIKMVCDTVMASEYYKRITEAKTFKETYGFETTYRLDPKTLVAAGVDPSKVDTLIHIVAVKLPSGKTDSKISDFSVLLRAMEQNTGLVKSMEELAARLNSMLAEVFKGSEPNTFYNVEKRRKNFDIDYVLKQPSLSKTKPAAKEDDEARGKKAGPGETEEDEEDKEEDEEEEAGPRA